MVIFKKCISQRSILVIQFRFIARVMDTAASNSLRTGTYKLHPPLIVNFDADDVFCLYLLLPWYACRYIVCFIFISSYFRSVFARNVDSLYLLFVHIHQDSHKLERQHSILSFSAGSKYDYLRKYEKIQLKPEIVQRNERLFVQINL